MILFDGPVFDVTGYSSALRLLMKVFLKLNVSFRLGARDNWSNLGVKLDDDEYRIIVDHLFKPDDQDRITHAYMLQKMTLNGFPGRKIVHTMFETDQCPYSWIDNLNTADDVLVPTNSNVRAFQSSGVRNVRHMPFVVDADLFSPEARKHITGHEFKFLYVADTSARKNVDMLINAFFRVFRNSKDVILILKMFASRERELRELIERMKAMRLQYGIGEYPRVMLFPNLIPDAAMPGFINSCDCYVSTSHGEGFCIPILQAMACAKPVISVRFSAMEDYLDETVAIPLKHYVKPVTGAIVKQDENFYGHRWAEPSTEHLFALMEWVVGNKAEARKLGMAARKRVIDLYSYPVVAKMMAVFLKERGVPL